MWGTNWTFYYLQALFQNQNKQSNISSIHCIEFARRKGWWLGFEFSAYISSRRSSQFSVLEFSAYHQGVAKLCPTLWLKLADLRMNLWSKIINTRLNCIRLEGAFHKHRLNNTLQWDGMCKICNMKHGDMSFSTNTPLVTQHIAMIMQYLYLWIFSLTACPKPHPPSSTSSSTKAKLKKGIFFGGRSWNFISL